MSLPHIESVYTADSPLLHFVQPSALSLVELRAFLSTLMNKGCLGNDLNAVNMRLFAEKYGITLSLEEGVLYRHYENNERFEGYGFPQCPEHLLPEALERTAQDAITRGREWRFVLLTEEERELLERFYPQSFHYSSNRDDSDYIYSAEKLQKLPGTAYHKKRNHLSRLHRQAEKQGIKLETVALDPAKHGKSVLELAALWLSSRSESNYHMELELRYLQEMLHSWEELGLGGQLVIYAGELSAFSIYSQTREGEYNTHVEKVHPQRRELYPLINQCTAQVLQEMGACSINREEDLGHAGLRKAKLSYHPQVLLTKYKAESI